jgi:hypothetical protein
LLPVDPARRSCKRHLITGAWDVPLAPTLTDDTQLLPLVDAIPPLRGRGRADPNSMMFNQAIFLPTGGLTPSDGGVTTASAPADSRPRRRQPTPEAPLTRAQPLSPGIWMPEIRHSRGDTRNLEHSLGYGHETAVRGRAGRVAGWVRYVADRPRAACWPLQTWVMVGWWGSPRAWVGALGVWGSGWLPVR